MHTARLRLRIGKLPDPLPPAVQQVVYRVAQECLQNVAKHSQASAVNLLLQSADQNIRLSVSDNGAGFGAERAWSKTMSFGLSGMRERAATLGGTLSVSSTPGRGARIVLSLPARMDGNQAGNHGRKAQVSALKSTRAAGLKAATVGSNGKNSCITN